MCTCVGMVSEIISFLKENPSEPIRIIALYYMWIISARKQDLASIHCCDLWCLSQEHMLQSAQKLPVFWVHELLCFCVAVH